MPLSDAQVNFLRAINLPNTDEIADLFWLGFVSHQYDRRRSVRRLSLTARGRAALEEDKPDE